MVTSNKVKTFLNTTTETKRLIFLC